jgi:acid phosphatase (class A)
VQRLVRTRSAERLAQAKWDNEHEDATAFSGTLGPAFDLQKLPETAKLLNLVLNDQAVAASAANQFFQRRSPVAAVPAEVEAYSEWTCDKASKKPGDRPGGRSYPSGHTTLGYSVGIVLAALIPDKAQAILARAVDYGYSREVCGDHYHSDVDASRAYGTALGIAFLNNATLQPMILAARSELQAAR